jgi:tetratricopeptide (TPR) repeat protein
MRRVKDKGGASPAPPSATRIKIAPAQGEETAPSATTCLERAMKAKTPAARAKHARKGLSAVCDVETQGLLLRQLYLGELEGGDFARARTAAEQMIALGVLGDVAHHDAARACQAMGDFDAAVAHLEEASLVGPPHRRSFHLSTLGGLLYAIGRAADATDPLARAVEQGEDAATPLLRGQLALARHAADGDEGDLDYAYHELLRDPSGEGYGRFVLGELASARGDRLSARLHLEAFIAKVRRSRPAAQAALSPEVARATATLGSTVWN